MGTVGGNENSDLKTTYLFRGLKIHGYDYLTYRTAAPASTWDESTLVGGWLLLVGRQSMVGGRSRHRPNSRCAG